MDSKTVLRIGAALALASTTLATPLQTLNTAHKSANEVANLTWTVDRHVLSTWECVGQSCLIADTAGSTGRNPTMRAEGAKDADIKCIIAHNPPVGDLLTKYFGHPPEVPKQKTGASSALMGGLNSMMRPGTAKKGSKETGTFKAACAPNILIFAKGTLEPGEFGILVGPPFTSKLPKGWSKAGVQYDADIPGDYCLGLPGGLVARDVINQAAAKCPNSKLFVSGYSQGAMVIRNGLARASAAAKAQVKVRPSKSRREPETNKAQGVITFGDPFNGSPIRGYNGPIQIYCKPGDGVCSGNFELTGAHLSYQGGKGSSVTDALAKLVEMSNGGGDSNCCHPPELAPSPSPEQWAKVLKANGGKAPKAPAGTSVEEWAKQIYNIASKAT
jgi:hypothetical protein